MSLIRLKTLIGLTGMQVQNSSINFRSQNLHSQPFCLCVDESMGLNGCMYVVDAWICIYVWLAVKRIYLQRYACVCMCVLDMSKHLITYIYACMNEMGGK